MLQQRTPVVRLLTQYRSFCISCGAGNLARSRLSGGSFGRRASSSHGQTPAESRRQPGLDAPPNVLDRISGKTSGIGLLTCPPPTSGRSADAWIKNKEAVFLSAGGIF